MLAPDYHYSIFKHMCVEFAVVSSRLTLKVLSHYSGFSSLMKNQRFQIPVAIKKR